MANQIEAKSGNLTATWNRESGELMVRVDGETLAPQQWQAGKFIELGDDMESRSDDLREALEQAIYPSKVAAEVSARRPDLAKGDAISSVLTADPTLTAEEAIAALDEAAEEHTTNRAAEQ